MRRACIETTFCMDAAKWSKVFEQALSALKNVRPRARPGIASRRPSIRLEVWPSDLTLTIKCSNRAPLRAADFIDPQPRWKGAKMAVLISVDVKPFNYEAVAELFPARNRKFNRHFARYRRFDRAADALRFAIEELPPQLFLGAYLEVEEERFDSKEMRRLYDSAQFPLARRAAV
jgi:hypothetical protein